MKSLLSPVKFGSIELKNRLVMAPLTRSRASGADGRTPNSLMQEYYVQRASAGMILTEATSVTPMGVGYANTPGIWSEDHVREWKKITDAVHRVGGKIVLQLWHVGRISDPFFLDGALPVAPSAIAAEGHVSLLRPKRPYVVPRALETNEIPGIIEAYRKGAENALKANFDGVEIHGANGYLLDQFLHDGSNKRTDQYGGSIENRSRLMLEVTDAVISVWGSDRVGMHLAPRGDSHDVKDSNPRALFSYIAEELKKRKIAFICTREYLADDSLSAEMKKFFQGGFIANENFDFAGAEKVIVSGNADAVAFGKSFIANPDLVERYAEGDKLNDPVFETFYAPGAEGYTDYPFRR